MDTHVLAPITRFHSQKLHSPRALGTPTEPTALAVVLTELCESLETLVLTSESVPLAILARVRWPRLRRLAFYGTQWTESRPMSAALPVGMQSLRDLSYELYTNTSEARTQVYDRLQLSPPLERSVLSEPAPLDNVFEHLPPTLRALSLRYWPHLHDQQYFHTTAFYDNPRYGLVVNSSDVLSILRRCAGLGLDQLGLEYRADEEEGALLRFPPSHVIEAPQLSLWSMMTNVMSPL